MHEADATAGPGSLGAGFACGAGTRWRACDVGFSLAVLVGLLLKASRELTLRERQAGRGLSLRRAAI